MNNIKLKKEIFNNIKESKQNIVILENENLENEEKITIENETTGEKIRAQITSKNIFNSIKDVLEIFPAKLFGDNVLYQKNINKVIVYRIKANVDTDINNLILDSEIYKIIDINSIEEIKIGRSTSKVFKAKTNAKNEDVILKIQYLPSRTSIKDEFDRLVWLQDKINSPKVYYWNEKCEYKYLIMEYKKGVPAFKYDNIGYRLGKELKKIHNINIEECKFKNNLPEKLLLNCLEKIEAIFPEIQKKYNNETLESIIKFLNENIPKDNVFTHGDYSLPNILIDNEKYSFIDLGDANISTKYFDFYYFFRSLKINKKECMISEFLKGYGIKEVDYNYLKWMDIIDKSLY